MIVLANLDCEWQLARLVAASRARILRPLPERVLRRISLFGTLLRVFAEPGDDLWTPAPVPPRCMRHVPELPEPALLAEEEVEGTSLRLAWCRRQPEVLVCNHRGFALEIGRALGTAAPETTEVSDLDALEMRLPKTGAWVIKAPLSAAGRDRVRGEGADLDEPTRDRLARLFRDHGVGLYEPWVERVADFGYGPTGLPHTLEVDGGGRFRGIVIPGGRLREEESAAVARVRAAVRDALAAAGYAGPWGVDAWRYRDAEGDEQFQPLGELNARMTFGGVARALRERVAVPRWGEDCVTALRFGDEPECDDADTIALAGDEAGTTMNAWLERLAPNASTPGPA